MRIIRLSVLLLGLFEGCDVRRPVSSEELKAFVLDPENGLRKSVTASNDIRLEILYRPKQLVLEQEAVDEVESRQEVERKLDSLDYFVLNISKHNQEIENAYSGDPENFDKAIQYLSTGIGGDISLIGLHTFPVEASMYVRSFGTAESTSILIVFKSYIAKQNGRLSIIFEDTFFGSGRNEFQFDTQDIKSIASLKI